MGQDIATCIYLLPKTLVIQRSPDMLTFENLQTALLEILVNGAVILFCIFIPLILVLRATYNKKEIF